jgi:hypothetical protein
VASANDKASPSGKPIDAQIGAVDTGREELVSQIDLARKLNGERSPVVFERLLDLLTYLVQSNQEKSLSIRNEELEKRFSTLTPIEQQYFALQLLELATRAVRQQSLSIASILYAPIIKSSAHARWENRAELVSALCGLASSLEQQRRPVEAENVLQAACRITASGPTGDTRAIGDLANLQVRLKMYGKAAEQFEKILQEGGQQSDCHDLAQLVKIYETTGNRSKLIALCPRICARVRKTNTDQDVSSLAPIVTSYLVIGLSEQGKAILLCLLERVQANSFDIPQQSSEIMSTALSSLTGDKYQANTQAMYKMWTDLVKKKYGANSPEWLDAMLRRFSSDIPASLQAEREIQQEKIEPGSVSQRITCITLLSMFSKQRRAYVLEFLQRLTTNVPNERETPILFNRAGDLYSRFYLKDQCQSCQFRAIASLESGFTPQEMWWSPYLQKLAKSACDKENNSEFSNFLSDMVTKTENHQGNKDRVILNELSRQGLELECEHFIQKQLSQLSAYRPNRGELLSLVQEYIIRQQIKNNLPVTRDDKPDLDFVGQAYCFYLQPLLQVKWKPETAAPGDCEISFTLERNEVDDYQTVQKSNKQRDSEALQSISSISDIASELPWFGALQFKAVFNFQSRSVTLSSLQKSGKWYSPPSLQP